MARRSAATASFSACRSFRVRVSMLLGRCETLGRCAPTFRSFGFAYGFIYLTHRFAVAGIADPGSPARIGISDTGWNRIRLLVKTHTIITGNAILACEGKRAELTPGGFNYMPAKMVHEAWLPASWLTFITVDGAWDVNWVEGPPTAADLTK